MMTKTTEKSEGRAVLPDYYARLGVAEDASAEEIRRVYGEKVRDAMGDRWRFMALNEAFDVLKDAAKRAAYDRKRRIAAQEAVADAESDTEATGGGGTIATAPAHAAERTQVVGAFTLPTVCAMDLSPCPLLDRVVLPDEGFCPECGVLLGAALGDVFTTRPLPRLIDAQMREYPLRLGENIVGREGADVMLPDKTVSRRHAAIHVEEGGAVWMEDLGSTNGTQRAAASLPAGQRASLSNGMAIQFGGVKLIVFLPEGQDDMLALPSPAEEGDEATATPAIDAPAGTAAAHLVGADGASHVLRSARTTFGRRPDVNVVLTGDSFVSGRHAAISYEGDGFVVIDLDSTNGTRLNGQKLLPNKPEPLKDGDEIIMGKTGFVFHGPS